MLGSVAAISAVSITIPNDPDILCLLGYKLTAMSVSGPDIGRTALSSKKILGHRDTTQRDRMDIQRKQDWRH